MIIRPLTLATSFILLTAGFSPALGQESPEEKANRLLAQIYSMPNLPELSPVEIRIDKIEKQSFAYYVSRPKRFFGLKTSKTPEIHLWEGFVRYYSDKAVIVTLAHELGHHFGFPNTKFYFEPEKPVDKLLRNYQWAEESQYFAEALALHILGEELYKKGRLDFALTSMRNQNGVYWLYIGTNPLLYKYNRDLAELWVNYWLEGARSKLDDIQFEIYFNRELKQ